MTDEPAPVETGDEPVVDTAPEVPAGNPAWDDMLGIIPPALHSAITPHLQKWDQNFQEVTTKYSPYKQFLDQGIDPAKLTEGLNFAQFAQDNPRAIYDALIQNFGAEWGVNGQGQPETGPAQPSVDLTDSFDPAGTSPAQAPYDIENDPVVVKLRADMDTIARAMTSEREQVQQQEINAQIDQELTTLKEKFGGFDERYVFSLAASGKYSLEQAVQNYKEMEQGIISQQAPQPFAPRVVSPNGGGMPSNRVDVTKLGEKDARSLAVQLAQSMTQNQ